MSLKKSIIAISIISVLSACQFDGDNGTQGEIGKTGPQGVIGQQGAAGESAIRNVRVEVVGRFSAGGSEIAGKSAAEIVQFLLPSIVQKIK